MSNNARTCASSIANVTPSRLKLSSSRGLLARPARAAATATGTLLACHSLARERPERAIAHLRSHDDLQRTDCGVPFSDPGPAMPGEDCRRVGDRTRTAILAHRLHDAWHALRRELASRDAGELCQGVLHDAAAGELDHDAAGVAGDRPITIRSPKAP